MPPTDKSKPTPPGQAKHAEPAPAPEPVEAPVEVLDPSADDLRAEPTDNGLRPDDPPETEQPPQDPSWLPTGTQTDADAQEDPQ